eukprot:Pgem_evm1s13707
MIKELNKKKNSAPGEDKITYEALLHIIEQLVVIFNKSMHLSHIPHQWKHVIIKMFPKSNKSTLNETNYRPINRQKMPYSESCNEDGKLPANTPKPDMALFADDITVFTVAANNNQIERTFQKTLNTISLWMKRWRTRVAIDQDKTHSYPFNAKITTASKTAKKEKNRTNIQWHTSF